MVRLRVHDLNEPLSGVEPADVTFCFSVVAHLDRTDRLVDALRSLTRKALYFEGHSNSRAEEYAYVLDAGLLSRVDLIGYTQASVDDETLNRPLWRCEV